MMKDVRTGKTDGGTAALTTAAPPSARGARRRTRRTSPAALLIIASPFACLCAQVSCTTGPVGGSLNSATSSVNAVAANLRAAAGATPQASAAAPAATPTPEASPQGGTSTGTQTLLVPVEGVRPEDLQDTYTQSRAEGRAHNAIDIPAARGTPVLAAADGRIVKLFQSVPGGITLYQLGTDGRTVYYYAHLERYADGIAEGFNARRGEVIGYVGDTGNAGAGNYHLHFSVSEVSDPKRWWSGTNVNPYPLLVER